MLPDVEKQKRLLVRLALWAALAAVVLLAVKITVRCLLPFVLALATAAVLQPPLRFFVRHSGGRRRYFSVVLVVAAVLLLVAVLLSLGLWVLTALLRFLEDPDNLEKIRQAVEAATGRLSAGLERWGSHLSAQTRALWDDLVRQAAEKLLQLAGDLFSQGAAGLFSFLTGALPSFFLAFTVWILACVLITADYQQTLRQLLRLVPMPYRRTVCRAGRVCAHTVCQLLRTYLLLMLLTFAELALGLWLLRIPGAVPLAALIAFVDLLPVLGTGTVLVPWALLAGLSGDRPLCGGLLLLFAVITLVRNVAEPHLVSRRIGLPPLLSLAAMYAGLRAAGLPALLLFPLALTVLLRLRQDGRPGKQNDFSVLRFRKKDDIL